MESIIKYPGGKEKELKFFEGFVPKTYANFYDPFVGGGSVWLSLDGEKCFINDKSTELVCLYRYIQHQDSDFLESLSKIDDSLCELLSFVNGCGDGFLQELYSKYRNREINDDVLKSQISLFFQSEQTGVLKQFLPTNTFNKFKRMRKIEQERGYMPDEDIFSNIETIFMSSLYEYYRFLYNKNNCSEFERTALFVYLRNYAYSGMFRFNAKGDFNVPYGGMAYNHKTLSNKLKYYQSDELLERFSRCEIECLDFEEFLQLHTPYDSDFSTYDKNVFGHAEHERLANYLTNNCKAKWMLVIKSTPFITGLYENTDVNIRTFDKKYTVNFKNRNNQNAEHLIITNY